MEKSARLYISGIWFIKKNKGACRLRLLFTFNNPKP